MDVAFFFFCGEGRERDRVGHSEREREDVESQVRERGQRGGQSAVCMCAVYAQCMCGVCVCSGAVVHLQAVDGLPEAVQEAGEDASEQ